AQHLNPLNAFALRFMGVLRHWTAAGTRRLQYAGGGVGIFFGAEFEGGDVGSFSRRLLCMSHETYSDANNDRDQCNQRFVIPSAARDLHFYLFHLTTRNLFELSSRAQRGISIFISSVSSSPEVLETNPRPNLSTSGSYM